MLDHPGLELQMVVSHGVDARDLTQVLASLEEQPVLLTVEPSLQALAFLSESKSQAGLLNSLLDSQSSRWSGALLPPTPQFFDFGRLDGIPGICHHACPVFECLT